MFLLDDILLSPMKGLVAVCRKVEEAAHRSSKTRKKKHDGVERFASPRRNGRDR